MNTMPVQSLLYTAFGRTCGYKTSHSDILTEFIAKKKKVKMDNNVIIKSNTSVVILSSAFSAKEREKNKHSNYKPKILA